MSTRARTLIGNALRRMREQRGYSQERLADAAGITYQYLSAVENGKENFSVGVLESLAMALQSQVPDLVIQAYADLALPPIDSGSFVAETPLPAGLTHFHIEEVLNEAHRVIRLLNSTIRSVAQRPLSDFIQANNFSGIVSNVLTDAFSRLTPYRLNNDQRYPDLICKDYDPPIGLEVKTTTQTGKGGESHIGHAGWHVIACFALDGQSGDIRFVHVMFADLLRSDWRYIGSAVNENTGSRRTETYNTTSVGTTKLRHGTVYLDTTRLDISRWRIDASVPTPACSPFQSKRAEPRR